MKLKFLLLGTSLSLIPNLTYAQCSPAQSCVELGYKETTNKGGCLKCPFGNSYYCPERCDVSYQYTCTGANEQPGTDKCGDKYKSCNCTSGFEWKDGKCQTKEAILGECTGYAKNCAIGQILNSDGTCSNDKVSGKTPIGVVAYISSGKDKCGQALALKDLGNMRWSNGLFDVPDLPNYTSISAAEKDFDSCGNTQMIIKLGNANTYPAAWGAVGFAPAAAPESKGKWCLPAAGVGCSMMNNYDKINSGLSKARGKMLPSKSNYDYWNWASSEASGDGALIWCYASDDWSGSVKIEDFAYVRPVIAF